MTTVDTLKCIVASLFDKMKRNYRAILVFFIIFMIAFISFTFLNNKINEESGIHEEVVLLNDNNKTKFIKLEDVREGIAAFQVNKEVFIVKEGEKRSIKDKAIRGSYYNGSFELMKVHEKSALVKFNIYQSINYVYLIAISLVASLFMMLTLSAIRKVRPK